MPDRLRSPVRQLGKVWLVQAPVYRHGLGQLYTFATGQMLSRPDGHLYCFSHAGRCLDHHGSSSVVFDTPDHGARVRASRQVCRYQ